MSGAAGLGAVPDTGGMPARTTVLDAAGRPQDGRGGPDSPPPVLDGPGNVTVPLSAAETPHRHRYETVIGGLACACGAKIP